MLSINTHKLNSSIRRRVVDLEASLGFLNKKFLVPLSWLGVQEQLPIMTVPFAFPSVLTQRPGHCSPPLHLTLTTVPCTLTHCSNPCTLTCCINALHTHTLQPLHSYTTAAPCTHALRQSLHTHTLQQCRAHSQWCPAHSHSAAVPCTLTSCSIASHAHRLLCTHMLQQCCAHSHTAAVLAHSHNWAVLAHCSNAPHSHTASLSQAITREPCTLLCCHCALHTTLQQCTGAQSSELCTLTLREAVSLCTLTGVPCLHTPLVLTILLCTHTFLNESGLQTHTAPFQTLKKWTFVQRNSMKLEMVVRAPYNPNIPLRLTFIEWCFTLFDLCTVFLLPLMHGGKENSCIFFKIRSQSWKRFWSVII